MNHEEIKKYIKSTILTGNRERIQKVMARYAQYIKEKKRDDIIDKAKEIFGVKKGNNE